MTKSNYLAKLLKLCDDMQLDLFNRMYPSGVDKQQLKLAIRQVETTLKTNTANEVVKSKKINELIKSETLLYEKIDKLSSQLEQIELELKASIKKIDRLTNPIDIYNNNLQEELLLLAALQAGGVDNWEFYDASIEQYNK